MGRSRVVAALGLGLFQLIVIVSLAALGPSDHPQRAPIRVVAPSVVASAVVDSANALPDSSLDARPLRSAQSARKSVREGRSVAAVVVDLANTRDTVYIAGANGSDLNKKVLQRIATFEEKFGRGVTVEDLVPEKAGLGGRVGVYGWAGLTVALGFVVALVITWLDGPRASSGRHGARRLGVVTAASFVAGGAIGVVGAIALGGSLTQWLILAPVVILVVALTSLALESLFGVVGLGVAATLFILTAAPLMQTTHPLLLPEPWSWLTPWLPHGAALSGATRAAYFDGGDPRPYLVLIVWALFGVLTLILARRERLREIRSSTPSPENT